MSTGVNDFLSAVDGDLGSVGCVITMTTRLMELCDGAWRTVSERLGEEIVPEKDRERAERKTSMVTVGLGMTVSLPNYQSARIDVGVRKPCEDSDDGRDEAYNEALAFCEAKMSVEVAKVRGGKGDRDGNGKR